MPVKDEDSGIVAVTKIVLDNIVWNTSGGRYEVTPEVEIVQLHLGENMKGSGHTLIKLYGKEQPVLPFFGYHQSYTIFPEGTSAFLRFKGDMEAILRQLDYNPLVLPDGITVPNLETVEIPAEKPYSLALVHAKPFSFPKQRHQGVEVIIGLSGRGLIVYQGLGKLLEAGSRFLIPQGTEHQLTVKEDLYMLCLHTSI